MTQQQDENGQDGREALRALLGQIGQIHQQGGTVFSQAALHGLFQQFADAPPDSPILGWIAETAAALGLSEADWQQLPEADGAFLGALFEQSRQVLGAGLPALAQIGFAVGEALARAHEDAMPVLGWLALGRLACLLEMGAGEAAAAIGRQALGLTAPVDESPGGLDAAGAARLQALWEVADALQSAGRHAEAEPLWAQVQAVVDALPGDGNEISISNIRAGVRLNRANNLQRLGEHRRAEALYADAQQRFDALEDSAAVLDSRARVRMNRANNLQGLGEHAEAETLYADAQQRFDALEDSAAVLDSRARVRMNRANNLQGLGEHAEAETLYADAQQRFDALEDSAAVLDSRARVRLNRANNLQGLGEHRRAEALYADAQQRFDALEDSAAVLVSRARVRLNRLRNREQAGDFSAATRALWDALWIQLEALWRQTAGEVARLLRLAGQRLVVLHAAEVVDADTCATQLRTLCTRALDWLDLVARTATREGGDATFTGPHVAGLFGTVQSWFAGRGQYATVVALLADYQSRYAAAYRLQSTLAAAANDTDPAAATADNLELAEARRIEQLGIEVRAAAHRLQVLESRPAELRDAGFEAERQRLRAEHARLATEQIERLSHFRTGAGLEAGQAEAFAAQRLRPLLAADSEGGRALVILQCVEAARPTDSDPDATVTRALALVLGPADPDWQAVDLPEALLAAVPVPVLQQGEDGKPVRVKPDPDGRTLIEAVRAAWALIEPLLGAAGEVHLGVHHTLGELPWSSAADRDLPPADVPLAGFDCLRRRLCVHLGVSLAVQALGRGPECRVAAPGPGRLLGVLAHSPAANDHAPLPGAEAASRGSQDPTRRNLDPIPGVYADLAITRQSVSHHLVLADGAAVLTSDAPLLQLSCHGASSSAHTGAGERHLGTYELRHHRRTPPEAVLLLACSTAQAGINAWGEADGWGAVLGDQVHLCFGALYPVSDPWTPLYTLLLHRAWQHRNDLKAAMAEVRARLRSGRWGDSEDEIDAIVEQYAQATASLPTRFATGETPAEMLERMSTSPRSRCALYASEAAPALRRLTEVFVVYG